MSPYDSPHDESVTELVALLLDQLAPALDAYRREFARRLDLQPVELACLEEVRRDPPTSSATIGRRTGLTRSSVAKMVRRLESRGHIERLVRRGEQEASFVLRAHEQRDREQARLAEDLHRRVADMVETSRLVGADRHHVAATWTAVAARAVGSCARQLADEADDARRFRERQRVWEATAASWSD